MFDIFAPILNEIKNSSNVEFYSIDFYYNYTEKLKKLSGYQNGKHFLPKYYSKSLEEFVRSVSLKDIEVSLHEISDKLRASLELGVNDFHYEVNSADGGLFETPGMTFNLQCKPDVNNLNEVIFTAHLALLANKIAQTKNSYMAFPFHFQYASVILPSSIDLKNFIGQLENFYKGQSSDISYYYDPSIQYLEITSKSSNKRILLYSDHFEVFFSDEYTIADFLENFLFKF
ncbi:MAG: hypothetical protein OEV78_12050 [Spirochaetia bacterium]|nr:hypothetical protein [Spirochaetia bacterium]